MRKISDKWLKGDPTKPVINPASFSSSRLKALIISIKHTGLSPDADKLMIRNGC